MITFVRKIKLAVINPTKEGKASDYEKFRTIQYHVWKLANKVVQGQLFLRIMPDVILFKYPKKYERFRAIQGEITRLKSLKQKDKPDNIKDLISSLYNEIKSINDEHKIEFDEYIRSQSIQNFTYSYNADEYRNLIPSNIRASINTKVVKDFKTKYKTFLQGSTSIQTYKRTLAVPFQKNAIINLTVNDMQDFTFTMFDVNFLCSLGKDGNNTKHILQTILKENSLVIVPL